MRVINRMLLKLIILLALPRISPDLRAPAFENSYTGREVLWRVWLAQSQ
jgi:hypothetical protein